MQGIFYQEFFNVQPSDFVVYLWTDASFECLHACFTSDHQTVHSIYVMGALILTYSRPLLQATYEVIELLPSSIPYGKIISTLTGIKPGTFRS